MSHHTYPFLQGKNLYIMKYSYEDEQCFFLEKEI